MDESKSAPISALAVMGAGILLIVGAITPWAQVFALSISGTDANWGLLTLLGGIVLLVLGYQLWRGGPLPSSWATPRNIGITVTIIAALSLIFSVWFVANVKSSVNEFQQEQSAPTDSGLGDEFDASLEDFESSLADAFTPRVGMGAWITILASLVGITGGVLVLKKREQGAEGAVASVEVL